MSLSCRQRLISKDQIPLDCTCERKPDFLNIWKLERFLLHCLTDSLLFTKAGSALQYLQENKLPKLLFDSCHCAADFFKHTINVWWLFFSMHVQLWRFYRYMLESDLQSFFKHFVDDYLSLFHSSCLMEYRGAALKTKKVKFIHLDYLFFFFCM